MKILKVLKIGVTVMVSLLLLIVGFGIYRFNYKKADIYYKVEDVQPKEEKFLYGSWELKHPESKNLHGFTLNADGTAYANNTHTVLYKSWKIVDSNLVLTAISLGNGTASVGEEKYEVISFNNYKLYLKVNDVQYIYEKLDEVVVESKNVELSTSFDYFLPNTSFNDTVLKHVVDFTSNSKGKRYQTIIESKYDSTAINFAAHYVIITWGCGSSCIDGVMVDVRDGKVYNLPSNKGVSDLGNDVMYFANSVLLKTSFTDTTLKPGTKTRPVKNSYWLWNESSKVFVKYN